MKLGKKSIGLFLCIASVFTVITGCKKKSTKKNTTKYNTTTNTTTNVTTKKVTTAQKTTTDPKKKYMVNEDTFNKYFHITDLESLSKINHTSNYKYVSSESDDKGIGRYNGTVYCDDYIREGEAEQYGMAESVLNIKDGIVYTRYAGYYGYMYIDDESVGIEKYLDSYIYLPFMNFTDLTFNESTNSYETTKIEKTGSTLKNIKIQFENNILKSYSYDYEGDFNFSYSSTVSNVGTTKTDSYLRNVVNKYEFDRFFNIFSDSILSDMNFTLEFDSSVSKYNLEYSYGKALAKTYFDGALESEKYYELTDADESGVVLDIYYVDDNGKWCYKGEETMELDVFVGSILYLYYFDWDNFLFNPETGCYHSDSYTGLDGNYSDLKIKFVDGLVDSFTAKVSSHGNEYNVKLTMSDIDTTEVVAPTSKYIVDEETFNSFLNVSSCDELEALNYTCEHTTKWGSETVYASDGAFMAIKPHEEEDDETYLYQTSESTTKDVQLKQYKYVENNWQVFSTMNLSFFDFFSDYGRMLQIAYSNFTYNDETKCYELDNYEVDLNLNYTDIKVSFEGGKIKTVTYTVNNFSNSWTVSETYTNIGSTEIIF
ncbi:MAG: hypothetical protein J6Y28_06225 [Acholeplasmatales bacterium]|nr:hypothetical protein [Acholeplasmatales bacterium]